MEERPSPCPSSCRGRTVRRAPACHLRPKFGMNQKAVAPPGAVGRRVGVAFVIAEGVMLAMIGDPSEGRAFAREAAEEGEQPADRAIGLKALVREQRW